MTEDALEPTERGRRPASLSVRVSVDGAQRLIDAWRDGRLERALGFSVAALQVETPFAPTPPAAGQGSPPPPGSAPAGSQPHPGPEPPSTTARPRSTGWRLAVIVALALVLLWLLSRTFIVNEDVEEEPTPAAGPSGVEGPPAVPALDRTQAPAPPGRPDSTPRPEGEAATSVSSEELAPVDAWAQAEASSGEPAVMEPSSTGEPTGGETSVGETGGGEPAPAEASPEPHARKGRAPKRATSKATPRPKDDAEKIYEHYRCQTEGVAFAIVVHARNQSEAKASACGGATADGACIAATTCVETKS